MTLQPEVPSVKLNDGHFMPLLGFGSSSVLGDKPGDPGYEALMMAFKCGYRHIDTAALYLNEEIVGQAIKDAINVGFFKREDLFICSKVWCTAHKRESVMRACKESLRKLQLTYVDLYLVHWPIPYAEDGDPITPIDPNTGKVSLGDTHYTETWRGMEDVKDAGLAKSIGLSNFNHEQIDQIIAMPCKHKPTVNQVECHPYLSQAKLLDYSNKKEIVLTAYCPLGSPGSCARSDQPAVLKDPVVAEIAKKYSKSSAQVLIRYQLQRKIAVIPKSISAKRIEENFNVLDFDISQEDMNKLLALNQNLRYCTESAGTNLKHHPWYPFNIEY